MDVSVVFIFLLYRKLYDVLKPTSYISLEQIVHKSYKNLLILTLRHLLNSTGKEEHVP